MIYNRDINLKQRSLEMKVSVYSTTTCPYCVMLKRWLKENDVDFQDILVDLDPKAARKMVELSGQMGVPFTTVEKDDGKMNGVVGFDRATLGQLIGVNS